MSDLKLSLSRRTAGGVTTDLLQVLLTAASARVAVALTPAADAAQPSELRLTIGAAGALTTGSSISRFISSIGQNAALLPAAGSGTDINAKIDQLIDFNENTLSAQVNASSASLVASLQYLDGLLAAHTPHGHAATHVHEPAKAGAAAADKKAAGPAVGLSFTGSHVVTAADVAIFASLYPVLSASGAAAAVAANAATTDAAAAGASAVSLAAASASYARVSAWFDRLRTRELHDALATAFAAAAAVGIATGAAAAAAPAAAAASDKKQKPKGGDQKSAAAPASAASAAAPAPSVVLSAPSQAARLFVPVTSLNPADVFDAAWAPRVPVGHTGFSWKRPIGASLAAVTTAAAGAAGAIKAGKRAEKTAAKHAQLKTREAEKAKRADEEAKKREAAANDKPKEVKSKGRVKPKAGDAATPTASASAAAEKAPEKVAEKPEYATGNVGASAPPKREVLPIKGRRNILITSALPYVNNVPHLGNIIGCVLSGDVYARFCRLRGHNTLYVCGTDEYGTATETKALQDKVTPQQLCDRFHVVHRDIYQWFNIGFDHFGRTTTPEQTAIAQDIFWACDKNKLVLQDKVEQLYCETCKRFLADRFIEGVCPRPDCKYDDARGDQCDQCGHLLNATELINPKCKLCRKPPVQRSSNHLFLDLPNLSSELDAFVSKSSVAGAWSANSIQITKSWLRDGLNPRCISRDLKWGTKVPKPGFDDKVFYVWFDAPIGYISITATYSKRWAEWWKTPDNGVQLYQFMGKDNIPFHTVIFPSTLLGTRQPYTLLHHISTCEYLNYESGKFSKSRGTGVFGDDAVKSGILSEVWRYYLLASRPESSDSVFLWEQFTNANNSELLANLGNYVQRSLTFVKAAFNGVVPTPTAKATAVDTALIAEVNKLTQEYVRLLEAVQIRDALKAVMKIAAAGNKYTQDNKPWVLVKSSAAGDKQRAELVVSLTVHLIRWLAALVEPFMPTVADKICTQLNCKLPEAVLREPADSKTAAAIDSKAAAASTAVVWDTHAFAVGHAIGEPIPIFREIKPEERDELKARFVGKAQDVKEVAAVPFPVSAVVGTVASAAAHAKAGLVTLLVDVGEAEPRLCISALGDAYPLTEFKGRRVVVVTNVKPSGTPKVTGSVLTADVADAKDATKVKRVLLTVDAKSGDAAGAKVAPKGVKLVPQKNFAIRTALPSLALSIDATGKLLYGAIAVESPSGPIIADKGVKSAVVSV